MKQEPYLFPLPPHISQTKLTNVLNLYQNFYKDKYFKDEELGYLAITTINNDKIHNYNILNIFFIFNDLILKIFKESLWFKNINKPQINIGFLHSSSRKEIFEFKYRLINVQGEGINVFIDYNKSNNTLILTFSTSKLNNDKPMQKGIIIKHKINADCNKSIIKNLLKPILYL